MEIVAEIAQGLHPELCQLLKQNVADQVLQAKFDELYAHVAERVRTSLAVAMRCYRLHHHHQSDYMYGMPYTAGLAHIEYNPLLTLVWDEISAVTRRYHVAPLKNGVTCMYGVTFLDCVTEDAGDAAITRQRRHALSTVCEQYGMADLLNMLLRPTYGIFKDGELVMSEKSVVLDVIFQHDAVDVLRLLLKDTTMRTVGMAAAMALVAEEFRAYACFKELLGYQEAYRSMWVGLYRDPATCVETATMLSSEICVRTIYNAFNMLKVIRNPSAKPVRLVENPISDYCQRFDDISSLMLPTDRKSQGVVFEKEDLQQTTMLLMELLDEVHKSGCNSGRPVHPADPNVTNASCEGTKALLRIMMATYHDLLTSLDATVHFCMAWINKIAKLLFQLDPLVARSSVHEFILCSTRPVCPASPKTLQLYAEFLLVCIRYGYHETRFVQDIGNGLFQCNGPILDVIRLHAQLLPCSSLKLHKTNAKEQCQKYIYRCIRDGNADRVGETLARSPKVLQLIEEIYEPKSVPSLQVLCRSKLYQLLPGWKLEALIEGAEIPVPVREYLALGTLHLQYDAISCNVHAI
jgi:hypothetical protein